MGGLFERHALVAVTTTDLARAKRFWVEALGCPVVEAGEDHFLADMGGVRLCVDSADGDLHRTGSTDPVLGLRVKSIGDSLAALASKGIRPERGPLAGRGGSWALLRDPDGRAVVLTEFD